MMMMTNAMESMLEGVQANSGVGKKVTISEKSTISVLSSWNLVKEPDVHHGKPLSSYNCPLK